MSALRNIFPFLFKFFLGIQVLYAQTDQELANSTIIVVNRSAPDSLQIGKYYAKQRGIPESNIVYLDAPIQETISITQYVESIANPLLNTLLDNFWVKGVKDTTKDAYGRERLSASIHSIRFVVLIRGVPLRIDNDPTQISEASNKLPNKFRVNNGSVDTEVALLLAPPSASMTAFIPNPYYGKNTISEQDANRVLKVSRLDGPTKLDVLRLIDRTLSLIHI